MKIEDEKLEQFTNDIMANVALKRQKVLAGVDKDIEAKYKEREKYLYSKAYDVMQEGSKHIEREKNEIISKTLMDNKIQLFHKRSEIIDDVFESVRTMLREYCKTEGYYTYLVDCIKEDLTQLEAGEKEIVINYSDRALKEALEKEFKIQVTVEIKQIDFLGGCKIIDKEHELFIDDSFESKLMAQREGFMQQCKIVVE